MTHSELLDFLDALLDAYEERIVSAERLAVGWLETRIPEEMKVYPTIVRIARSILSEGMSERVILPGATTTTDVEWWYRDRIAELTLETWFHPSVSIQRAEAPERGGDFSSRPETEVILPGDLLHVDFGITYRRLNTDTQMHAYVLRPGEDEAPAGLREGLSAGNRLQDILMAEFRAGRTGNEILKAGLDRARAEGIQATIYTHPIGFQGTAPDRPSASGIGSTGFRARATIPSSPIPPTRSSSTRPSPCPSGAARAFASCSRRTRSSTAKRPGTSTREWRNCS